METDDGERSLLERQPGLDHPAIIPGMCIAWSKRMQATCSAVVN
ncbi:MAG: hypothetical protein ABIH24_11685 [Verrucomicrobiota bacterium]